MDEGTTRQRSREEFRRLMREPAGTTGGDLPIEFAPIGTDSALRMALLPGWTSDTWSAIGVRPDQSTVTKAIADLERSGLLESGTVGDIDDDSPATVYQLTSPGRSSVLAGFLKDPSGVRHAVDVMQDVGNRMRKQSVHVPDSIRRWAELAVLANSGAEIAKAFEERINNSSGTADVSMWIDAARPISIILEQATDGRLELAVERAARKLDLLHRIAREQGRLKYFVPRREQIDPIRELVTGPDDRWALHLLGSGGVGKTMLLRHLTVDLASELNAAVARVDFDYMSADYPSYAPGELLWHFEEELRLRDPGTADRRFQVANRYLNRLHDELAAGRRPPSPKEALASPLLKDAIAEYVDALKALPRVILVLDTCEELLRLRPGRDVSENIDATFRILRALHDGPQTLEDPDAPAHPFTGLPSLRVIFAGRRPLAASGAGWTAESALPPRKFLRLLPLRGFDRGEAVEYLKTRRGVSADLVEPILGRLPVETHVPGIEHSENDRPRYSPHDLALYADWATEVPPPSKEVIEKATPAQYVELRVLGRLRDRALEQLMPVLATLKHADSALLRHLSDANDEEFAAMVERLRQQEWSTERAVTRGDATRVVYTVDETVRSRLWAYYRDRPVPSAARRAADYLEQLTLNADFYTLDWSDVDATIRALDADPPRAAAWWQQFETRMLRERGFAVLAKWLDQLFAEGSAAAKGEANAVQPPSAIRPLLLASLASATLHSGGARAAADVWAEVAETAATIEIPEIAETLRLRSTLGLIQGTGVMPAEGLWSLLERWRDRLDETLIGSFTAAAEIAVEGEESPLRPRDLLHAASGALGPVMLAERVDEPFVCSLAGRACALTGDFDQSERWFRQALDRLSAQAESAAPSLDRQRDWIPPSDIEARVQLEAIRALYPARLDPDKALNLGARRERQDETESSADLDRDRLGSLKLQLRLAQSPVLRVTGEVSSRSYLSSVVEPPRPGAGQLRNRTHTDVSPRYVSVADGCAANGLIDTALAMLHAALAQADQRPFAEVVWTQRAALQIGCRHRLAKERPTSLNPIRTAEDFGLVWLLEALTGSGDERVRPESEAGDPLEWAHQRWRTSVLPADSSDIEQAYRKAVAALQREGDTETPFLAAVVLDLTEAELIAVQPDGSTPRTRGSSSVWNDREQWPRNIWAPGSHRPDASARLLLRARVLFDPTDGIAPVESDVSLRNLESRLGTRRLAGIAFDEGTALALRLPERAGPLFDIASTYYKSCDDKVGVFLSAASRAILRRDPGTSAAQRIEDASQAWEGLRRQLDDSSLSAWSDLVAMSATLTPAALAKLPSQESAWRPWIARMVACLVRQRQLEEGRAVERAATWLTEEFGSPLPVDLQNILELPQPAAQSQPPASASPSTSRRALAGGLWTLRLVGQVAGTLLVVWLLYAIVSTFSCSLPQLSQPIGTPVGHPTSEWSMFSMLRSVANSVRSLPGMATVWVWTRTILRWTGSVLLITVPGILVVGGAIAAVRYLRDRRREGASIAIRVLATSGESERSRARFVTRVTMRLPRGLTSGAAEEASYQADVGGVFEYARQTVSLDGEARGALARLPPDKDIEVNIPDGLGGVCWEAVFVREPGSPTFNIRRTRGGRERGLFAEPTSSAARVLCCVNGRQNESMAHSGWSTSGPAGQPALVTFATSAYEHSNEDFPILHLIGNAEESTSGSVFELGSGTDAAAMRPIDVRELVPRAQLCILQGAPLRIVDERRDGARRDANVVRWFAHDLHGRGLPAILVIPPLETQHAAAAVATLAAALIRRRPFDRDALMRTARQIRASILNIDELPVRERWEIACDVCVYCPQEWMVLKGRTAIRMM